MIFDSVAAADHWILTQDPVPAVAGTIFADGRVRVILAPAPGARAVRFPGVDELTGMLPVAEVPPSVRVVLLGGGSFPAAALLDTRDFVRPIWTGDELILTTMPAGDGILVPFETRNPTPCCAAH